MPRFSVVVPAYNRHAMLRRALESVGRQTFRDFECIVVDDGSTDDTPLVEGEFPWIRYHHRGNAGVSAARNSGIRLSQAPYIALLDSDDEWLPGKLAAHAAYLAEGHPCRFHQTEELWVRDGRRVNPMEKHRKRDGDIFIPSLELCLVSPSAVLIDRRIFDEYGLFDENLPACEDYDLWLRVLWREEAGLIPRGYVMKYGGHSDQLSRRYWGMDRFRVYSILRLLGAHGSEMRPGDYAAARSVAMEKCRVLKEGARKRGREGFADLAGKVLGALRDESYSSIDPVSLLRE
jgi:glycosyltransferase involved in cell wall biosynthesis